MPNEQTLIKVYDSSLVLLGVVDDYESMFFQRSYYALGAFSIVINKNIPNASLLVKKRIVQFGNDSRDCGIITSVSNKIDENGKGGQYLRIKGYDLRFRFSQRIIRERDGADAYYATGKGETLIKDLVSSQCGPLCTEAERVLSLLEIDTDQLRGGEYSISAKYTSVYDECAQIARQTGIGWYVYLDAPNKKYILECYEGTDRRKSQSVNLRCVFSTDEDALRSATCNDDISTYKNLVYVGGDGSGSGRQILVGFETTEPEDDERFETFSDASSLSTTEDLEIKAEAVLEESAQTLDLTTSILENAQYRYKDAFDVGDVVTIAFNDEEYDARILDATESRENADYSLSLTIGKPIKGLVGQVRGLSTFVAGNAATGEAGTNVSGMKNGIISYDLSSADATMTASECIYNILRLTGTLTASRAFNMYLDTDRKYGRKVYVILVDAIADTGSRRITLDAGGDSVVISVTTEAKKLIYHVYINDDGDVVETNGTYGVDYDPIMPSKYGLVMSFSRCDLTGEATPRILDNSGNGNHGTIYGGATVSLGEKGVQVSLNGVDQYITSTYPDAAEYTLLVWYKGTSALSSDDTALLSLSRSSFSNRLKVYPKNGIASARMTSSDGSTSNFISGITPICDGAWHLLAARYKDSITELLVDAIVEGTPLTKAITSTYYNQVSIGKGAASTFLDGIGAEPRVYTRWLTDQEIRGALRGEYPCDTAYSIDKYHYDSAIGLSYIDPSQKLDDLVRFTRVAGAALDGASAGSYYRVKTDATAVGISTTNLTTAFNDLKTYLLTTPGVIAGHSTPSASPWNVVVAITKATYLGYWSAYDTEERKVQALIVYHKMPSKYGLVMSFSRCDLTGEPTPRILDNSGNANHGTIYGGATVSLGEKGVQVALDGSDDYIKASYPDASEYTVLCWYKGTFADSDNNASMINLLRQAGGARIKMLPYGGKLRLRMIDSDGGTGNYITSDTSINDDTMHLCAFTYTPGDTRLYVDAVEEGTRLDKTISALYYNEVRIGKTSSYVALSGIVAEPRIYTRVFTVQELRGALSGQWPEDIAFQSADWKLDNLALTTNVSAAARPRVLDLWNKVNGDGSTTGSYWTTKAKADDISVDTTALDDAYDALYAYLYTTPNVLGSTDPYVTIVAATWQALWAEYYSAEIDTLATISTRLALYQGKLDMDDPTEDDVFTALSAVLADGETMGLRGGWGDGGSTFHASHATRATTTITLYGLDDVGERASWACVDDSTDTVDSISIAW